MYATHTNHSLNHSLLVWIHSGQNGIKRFPLECLLITEFGGFKYITQHFDDG